MTCVTHRWRKYVEHWHSSGSASSLFWEKKLRKLWNEARISSNHTVSNFLVIQFFRKSVFQWRLSMFLQGKTSAFVNPCYASQSQGSIYWLFEFCYLVILFDILILIDPKIFSTTKRFVSYGIFLKKNPIKKWFLISNFHSICINHVTHIYVDNFLDWKYERILFIIFTCQSKFNSGGIQLWCYILLW